MKRGIFAGIDQGTSGTRTNLYDEEGRLLASAYETIATTHPQSGWDEQDGDQLVATIHSTLRDAMSKVGDAHLVSIGLANQGESIIAFDRVTRRPLAPAIVWSDRRSSHLIEEYKLRTEGAMVEHRTGLPLDPYFSAGKMSWLLSNSTDVANADAAGTLAIGTLDSFFIATLTDGRYFVTDPSTASRTQLMDLDSRQLDPECASFFGIAMGTLAEVIPTVPSQMIPSGLGAPIGALVCDQQAALLALGAINPGDLKVTYGTGAFIEMNVGAEAVRPGGGLMPTCAWELSSGARAYAIEGGVFCAATAVDWLVSLGVASSAAELSRIAETATEDSTHFLPAFTGLGAPWWRPSATGVIAGLRASSGRAEIAAAVFTGVAQQVADVIEAIGSIRNLPPVITVDGGLSQSAFLLQRQADLLGRPVVTSSQGEATAAGAAGLAAIGAGALDLPTLASRATRNRVFEPSIGEDQRQSIRADWKSFVQATEGLTFARAN
jgi:glycerol kinase